MNISKRVQKHTAPGVEMLSIKSPLREMILLKGSFPAGGAYTPKNPLLPDSVAVMLKEGTRRKHKQKIREILESRGALLSFSASELVTSFNLACLERDFPVILGLLEELIQEPSFPEKEWETLRRRSISAAEDILQDTGAMASIMLSRELYAPGHPLYGLLPQESVALFKKIKAPDLSAYHDSVYPGLSFKLSFAGPENSKIFRRILEVFQNKSVRAPAAPKLETKPVSGFLSKEVEIKDKTSASLILGQALSVHKLHPDYLPLMVGVEALGGDFAARLMQEVREKKGLTYGAYANIHKVYREFPGYFRASGTFAPSVLARGAETMLSVIARWRDKGLNSQELKERKETIRGSRAVWFSSTHNLLVSLLGILEEGREVGYLDELLSLVERLTLEEVNGAIKRHIDPKKLVAVRAGSLIGASK